MTTDTTKRPGPEGIPEDDLFDGAPGGLAYAAGRCAVKLVDASPGAGARRRAAQAAEAGDPTAPSLAPTLARALRCEPPRQDGGRGGVGRPESDRVDPPTRGREVSGSPSADIVPFLESFRGLLAPPPASGPTFADYLDRLLFGPYSEPHGPPGSHPPLLFAQRAWRLLDELRPDLYRVAEEALHAQSGGSFRHWLEDENLPELMRFLERHWEGRAEGGPKADSDQAGAPPQGPRPHETSRMGRREQVVRMEQAARFRRAVCGVLADAYREAIRWSARRGGERMPLLAALHEVASRLGIEAQDLKQAVEDRFESAATT